MKVSLEKPGTPQELVHHGIKGMKWGVRNQEQRAQKYDAKAANATSKRAINRNTKAASDIRSGRHLTDRQRKIAIGAGVAATVVATYGAYKLTDSGRGRQLLTKNTPFKKNDLLTRHMSHGEIMAHVVDPINPDFGSIGTKMNCRRASMAYELRRRGFDVKATRSIKGSGQTISGLGKAINQKEGFEGPFQSIKKVVSATREGTDIGTLIGPKLGKNIISDSSFATKSAQEKTAAIFKSLGSHPEGARGEISVLWKMKGAHSMAWEVINGEPHIIDAQIGKSFTSKNFGKLAEHVDSVGFTRLDNANLNMEFLKRWVANA